MPGGGHFGLGFFASAHHRRIENLMGTDARQDTKQTDVQKETAV
ncbi:MAG: hypothetical protein JWO94_855 [Verrucomicrobiaceae bacterium]|nr:hypothetical protein [Verrucomicrobiaceae bacterium]